MLTYQKDDINELGTHEKEGKETTELNYVCNLWQID